MKFGRPWQGELDVRVLAALYALRFTKTDQNYYMMIGHLASKAGLAPRKDEEFQKWFKTALEHVQERRTKSIATQRGMKGRLDSFKRVLNQVFEYEIEFREWQTVISPSLGRVSRVKRNKLTTLKKIKSREPFTKFEIEKIAANCASMAELALVCIY